MHTTQPILNHVHIRYTPSHYVDPIVLNMSGEYDHNSWRIYAGHDPGGRRAWRGLAELVAKFFFLTEC